MRMHTNGSVEMDPVRRHGATLNARFDHQMAERVEEHATRSRYEIGLAIERLDRGWDLDRATQLALALLAAPGLAVAATGRLGWLVMPAAALALLVEHAVQGWSPAIGLLRRFGLRTRRELEAERCALKALRGDFEAVCNSPNPVARAGKAIQAVTMH